MLCGVLCAVCCVLFAVCCVLCAVCCVNEYPDRPTKKLNVRTSSTFTEDGVQFLFK